MSQLVDFNPPEAGVVDAGAPDGPHDPDPTRRREDLPAPKRAHTPKGLWGRISATALDVWERVSPAVKAVGVVLAPVGNWLAAVAKSITGLGWTLLALGVIAWVMGARFGWAEAGIVAAFCFTAVALAALFTIGRAQVEVTLAVSPQRVRVLQSALATFEMTNTSSRKLASISVRLPVGRSAAHYTAPSLAPGDSFEDWVTIPTSRRGVVPVGPVITYRADPLGIVRREMGWTETVELFIHPEIVPLDSIGTGLLRDLEGQSTLDVSNADLAFHALRDYVPGDDRRHIHWKSTARLSAIAGEDKFMVRQFLDTRKTHVAVVSDLDSTHFTDEDEFEVALSCAASVAVRTVMDDMDLTILCGRQVVSRPKSNYALDSYSRAAMGNRSLETEFERVTAQAGDASMVVLVTGALTDFTDLQRGRSILPYTVRFLVVRVVLGEKITLRQSGGFIELTVGSLDDLPRALRGGLT